MQRNALLTAGAALAIVGVAVTGGYFLDRLPADQAELALQTPTPAAIPAAPLRKTAAASTKPNVKIAAVPAGAARGVTSAARTPVAPPKAAPQAALQAQAGPALDITAPDGARVAISGTVAGKKGNVLTLKESAGLVRVVMREDTPRPRDIGAYTSTADRIGVGAPVTVYGKLRTNEEIPKVYADAVYDPAARKLYALNDRVTGNKPAAQLTVAEIAARYTPVGGTRAAGAAKPADTAMAER